MKLLFLDTETTGLEEDRMEHKNTNNGVHEHILKGAEVIQIGGLVTDINLNPIKLFCHHCDTTVCNMSNEVRNIHGITMEFLRENVKDIYLEEVIEKELPELYESDIITIGYNIKFDIKMITQTLRNSNHIPDFGKTIQNGVLPSKGRYTLDLLPFYTKFYQGKQIRQKLQNLARERKEAYSNFFKENCDVSLYTNIDINKAFPEGIASHNSLYDSIICYLLTKELWNQKLHY